MITKIVTVILMFAGMAGYVAYSQNKIDGLKDANAEYALADKQSKQVINTLQKHSKEMEKLQSELQENLKKSEKYNDELRSTLQKHNLTMLARKKPKLIEKRINDASKKIFDTISNDTNF